MQLYIYIYFLIICIYIPSSNLYTLFQSAQVWHMDSQRNLSVASHFHSNELSLIKSDKKKGRGNHNGQNDDNNDIVDDDEEEDDGKEYMELTVLEAKGLPKADVFGSSDPYVIVKWSDDDDDNNVNNDWNNNKQQRGAAATVAGGYGEQEGGGGEDEGEGFVGDNTLLITDVIMDNLNPVWGDGSGESTVIGIDPETPERELVFEVMHTCIFHYPFFFLYHNTHPYKKCR